MSQFIQPQQIEEQALIAAQAACDAAAQARVSAQLTREYIDSQSNETNEITWVIDRTPNYNYSFDNTYDYIIYTNVNNSQNNTIEYINIQPTIRFDEPRQNINIVYKSLQITDQETNCCICMETREKNEICLLNCNHKFCGYCVENCIKIKEKYNCSLCREVVNTIITQKLQIQEKLYEYII